MPEELGKSATPMTEQAQQVVVFQTYIEEHPPPQHHHYVAGGTHHGYPHQLYEEGGITYYNVKGANKP